MASLFAQLAAVLLGLLGGAMLLIGVALLPWWTSLPPLEFSRWFAAHSPAIGRLMVPLGTSATLTTLVAAVLARVRDLRGWLWLFLAAACAVFVAAVYPLYFSAANAALVSGTLSADEVAAELARWHSWHWARTAAGVIAFAAAVHGSVLVRESQAL